MKAARERFLLRRISSGLRYSSVWEAVCNGGACSERERAQEWLDNSAGGLIGVQRRGLSSEGGLRWFVTTSSLSGTRVSSKHSRDYPKVDRRGAVGVKAGGSVLGPGSRVRHGPNLAFKALNQTGLQDSTKAVVLGSLLGDSTLHIVKGMYCRMLEMVFQF